MLHAAAEVATRSRVYIHGITWRGMFYYYVDLTECRCCTRTIWHVMLELLTLMIRSEAGCSVGGLWRRRLTSSQRSSASIYGARIGTNVAADASASPSAWPASAPSSGGAPTAVVHPETGAAQQRDGVQRRIEFSNDSNGE